MLLKYYSTNLYIHICIINAIEWYRGTPKNDLHRIELKTIKVGYLTHGTCINLYNINTYILNLELHVIF